MASVYIVGTWHNWARGSLGFVPSVEAAENLAFESEIDRLVQSYSIKALAEEDFPRPHDLCCRPTAAQMVAKKHNLNRIPIDFDTEEYKQKGFWPLRAAQRAEVDEWRESHWAQELKTLADKHGSVLFVCGGYHTESMRERLRREGLEAFEVHSCWGGRWDTDSKDPYSAS